MANCVTSDNPGMVQPCIEPSNYSQCKPWQLTKSRDSCYLESLNQDLLNISGADINVFKLLGIHEQTKLVDVTGDGIAISGGDQRHFPASNAFDVFRTEWRSFQTGTNVSGNAYIGYDFGIIKLDNGRVRYGVEAVHRYEITMIRIKQSSKENMRATKARIERSEDGKTWYGVAAISLPNDDSLNEIRFRQSVPCRFWRIRATTFNGQDGDPWGIQALELIESEAIGLDAIQDKVLMENRNREYQQPPILVKGTYDVIDVSSELSRFGIDIGQTTYTIKIVFSTCLQLLARPIVIGDMIELPSEVQYTPQMKPIKRYLEVTDVTWDSSSMTPGWQHTALRITAQPALASEETQDIFGDLKQSIDASGVFDTYEPPVWQDFTDITRTIHNEANSAVNERGADGSNTVREFTENEIEIADSEGFGNLQKINLRPNAIYVEDAIPSNGEPYSEGPEYPTSPKDGDYHRMTYEGLSKDVPARLYRWSVAKGRWIFLESDKRSQFNTQKAILNEYLTSPNRTPARNI